MDRDRADGPAAIIPGHGPFRQLARRCPAGAARYSPPAAPLAEPRPPPTTPGPAIRADPTPPIGQALQEVAREDFRDRWGCDGYSSSNIKAAYPSLNGKNARTDPIGGGGDAAAGAAQPCPAPAAPPPPRAETQTRTCARTGARGASFDGRPSRPMPATQVCRSTPRLRIRAPGRLASPPPPMCRSYFTRRSPASSSQRWIPAESTHGDRQEPVALGAVFHPEHRDQGPGRHRDRIRIEEYHLGERDRRDAGRQDVHGR